MGGVKIATGVASLFLAATAEVGTGGAATPFAAYAAMEAVLKIGSGIVDVYAEWASPSQRQPYVVPAHFQ